MKLQRLYNSQEEVFKAINGMEVNDANLISNNLEWNNNLFCRPVIYLDVEFRDN